MARPLISLYLVIHNVRSVHNVGSLFRTADGAGVSKIFLTGYTPIPHDTFGKLRNEFKKTALGAERSVFWEQHKNIGVLMRALKSEARLSIRAENKVFIAALEQSSRSVSYKKFFLRFGKKLKKYSAIALVVGNEVHGLSPSILKNSDAIIEISMRGRMVRQVHHPRRTRRGKESLNVSVAAGIALFECAANLR